MYTKVPRPVMWLLRGDVAELGGEHGEPEFTVEIESFYVSRGCVTNEQFAVFQRDFDRHPLSPSDDDPAVGVGFRDAVAYAAWYADLSGRPFRLLTEVEWEFAARAQGRRQYPWGDDPADSGPFAWTRENSDGRCHPIDQVRPSKSGLYGMIGNAWEWTSSLYQPYPVAPADGREDLSTVGDRVIRGGGFDDPVAELSCGRRVAAPESTRRPDLSFRIGRTL
jgi:formylglycine-generating enzyme required for sulfatase activity